MDLLLAAPYSKFPNVTSINAQSFRGDRLREARNKKGFSQSKLAGKIGAHVTSISDWERGDNAPSGRHVANLSRELDVSVAHLYGTDVEDAEDRLRSSSLDIHLLEQIYLAVGAAVQMEKLRS